MMERNSTSIFFYYTVSGPPPYSVYILRYILTENIYMTNLHTQMSSNQSEERTMFFTRKKKKSLITIANDVFSSVRKIIRPIKSHRGV